MEVTLDGVCDIKLYQNRYGYRFSIDALLLYAFVNVKYAKEIVDLGAGSGIIGLLLAKKYTGSKVLLIELQEALYRLAEKNIRLNGFDDRVSAVLNDIKDIKITLKPMSCDIVVSNPPFRKPGSGHINIAEEKAVARHEIKLGLTGLVESAAYLLNDKGRFFMIFHPERILEVVDTLRLKRLEPKRIRFVHHDIATESKIVLVEAVKDGRAGIKVLNPLFIYGEDGSYTDEVKEMYGRGAELSF